MIDYTNVITSFEMTMNSKHRTEKLKTKNQKDIETRKIKTKGAKNRKNRYKMQSYIISY